MPSGGDRKRRKSRAPRRKKTNAPLPAAVWIVAAAMLVAAVLWWVLRPGPAGPASDRSLEAVLGDMAADHGVAEDGIETDVEIRKVDGVFVRTWRLRFPSSASRQEFIAEATILGDRDDVTVSEPESGVGGVIGLRLDHGVEAFRLELGVDRSRQGYTTPESIAAPTRRPAPSPTPRPEPPPDARGRLAILLDDAGQSMDLVPAASRLPAAVGIAVLPFLPYSAETALAVHETGHEVWLHLPMEAVGNEDPGPGALMSSMSGDELRDAVFMAINNIPHVVGINNHMGSKATANLKMMTWMMQDLAAMDLAFIDSRTTVQTVAEEAARAQGVKTGRRHVFLDNERTGAAVRAQLAEAVYRARMEGEIIAIGHLTEVTVGVLAEELPGLDARGVTLVKPTALLR